MRSLLTLSPCQFLFQVLPWVAVLLPEHLQSPYPWDEPRHQFPHPVQPAALQISHIDLWGRSTQKMHLLFSNRLHTLQTFGLFWGLQDLSSQEKIPRPAPPRRGIRVTEGAETCGIGGVAMRDVEPIAKRSQQQINDDKHP